MDRRRYLVFLWWVGVMSLTAAINCEFKKVGAVVETNHADIQIPLDTTSLINNIKTLQDTLVQVFLSNHHAETKIRLTQLRKRLLRLLVRVRTLLDFENQQVVCVR